jgi:hypothetical protein
MSLGRRLSDLVALGAASFSVAYGTYLLAIGPNSPYLTPEGVAGTIQSPTFAGAIPLGIGLLAIWAVIKRRTAGLWAAGALALASSVVFLFSFSLPFALIAAFLLLAAAMRTAATHDIRRR